MNTKEFNNEASRISINAGVSLTVARNVLRWRNRNVKKSKPKDFTYGLPYEKLYSPLFRKIAFGTVSKETPVNHNFSHFETSDPERSMLFYKLHQAGML